MTTLPLLWADMQWLNWAAPLLAFAVWVLNRMLGAESIAAKQQKAREQARAKAAPPPGNKQRVEDEVGEFLRRAAQQKSGNAPNPPPPRPPKVLRAPTIRSAAPRRRDAGIERRPHSSTWRDGDARGGYRSADTAGPRSAQRSAACDGGDGVSPATDVWQANRHARAEGAPAAESTADGPADPLGDVTSLLRNPRSIRDAVVISEILRRPEHRW